MYKVTVLTMMFMSTVCGMDRELVLQKQKPRKSNLEVLHQESSHPFSQIPTDLFPMIESYKAARQEDLQQKLNEAKSFKEIINLGKTEKHFKVGSFYLDLRKYKNEVTDEGLADLVVLFPQLESLDLSRCINITPVGLKHIESLKKLTSLKFSSCPNITDAVLASLVSSLPQLESLDFAHCDKITDNGVSFLRSLKRLRSLNLKGCSKITDKGISYLTFLRRLRSLNLGGCDNITDSGVSYLTSLKRLRSLDMSFCEKITHAGFKHLASLKGIRYLNLAGCPNMTNAVVADLVVFFPQLQSLDLMFCDKITYTVLADLASMKKLKFLNLAFCDNIPHAKIDEFKEKFPRIAIKS